MQTDIKNLTIKIEVDNSNAHKEMLDTIKILSNIGKSFETIGETITSVFIKSFKGFIDINI